MTGMRIGEAAALQWSDINFKTGLLSITKTLYYKTMDEYKFVEPNTQASIRTIYIDTYTLEELKAWQEVQQKVLKDCDLVLIYNGIPTSKHTLPRALEKLAGLAGVHRIKIHALIHSHASLLISMGENPLLIKERLAFSLILRQQPALPITPAISIQQFITEQLNKKMQSKCNSKRKEPQNP